MSAKEGTPNIGGFLSDLMAEPSTLSEKTTCQTIDWYSEGQSRTVEVAGVRITVRFIGRKGRRGRIAIEAPAGAEFWEAAVPSQFVD